MHVSVDPFHLPSLFQLRSLADAIDGSAAPAIKTLSPLPRCGSVAILPGSFNPPTAAHGLLAERALSEGFERVLFALPLRPLGKPQTGLILEDRLIALRALGGTVTGVGLCSHGLYADMAEAACAAFPDARVTFLIGSDKVLQIFDGRWYRDRDEALDRLFARASMLVAPRFDQTERMREVLRAPANRRFADRVSVLRLHPAVSDLSSTRVRGLLRAGADPAGLVPGVVADLLRQTGAFATPLVVGGDEVDAYDVRARLIDLVWRERGHDGAGIDLGRLVRIALSPTDAGRSLRRRLWSGAVHAEELETV
ncbi:MAG TPA: hypothetical protein VGB83_01365 [Actinomycetota bacterium]